VPPFGVIMKATGLSLLSTWDTIRPPVDGRSIETLPASLAVLNLPVLDAVSSHWLSPSWLTLRCKYPQNYTLYGPIPASKCYNYPMEYPILKQFDPETQKLMAKYMNLAGLSDLKEKSDFEKFFVAMMEDFMEMKLSLDNLSLLCGDLWVLLSKDPKAVHDDFATEMLNGDEINWYSRNAPEKVGGYIKSLIKLYDRIVAKNYDPAFVINKYPLLANLKDTETQRLLAIYFNKLDLTEVNELQLKELFNSVMADLMLGKYYLKDNIKICSGLEVLFKFKLREFPTSEFIKEVLSAIQLAKQTETENMWWRNAKQMLDIYKKTRTNKGDSRHSPPLDANFGNDPRSEI